MKKATIKNILKQTISLALVFIIIFSGFTSLFEIEVIKAADGEIADSKVALQAEVDKEEEVKNSYKYKMQQATKK